MTGFQIEVLRPEHNREGFSRGSAILDRYLAERVTKDVKRRISNCFVALDAEGILAGYYTFAATSVPLSDLPPEDVEKLPRYALLPAGLIGRLAIDRRFQGRHLGSALVMDAVQRSMHANPAIFALVVDAKMNARAGYTNIWAFDAASAGL